MGTRGAYGYRLDGRDKVTYNHYDSYPIGLGLQILTYTLFNELETMRAVARRIELVDAESQPSPELVNRYRHYLDTRGGVSETPTWYWLLRETQGDLQPYHCDLRHMIDSQAFLYDSLFCEWAYVINLDNEQFEVYRGFNQDPSRSGRYASQRSGRDNPYYGVVLIREFPFAEFSRGTIDDMVKEMERLDEL